VSVCGDPEAVSDEEESPHRKRERGKTSPRAT
jgi:hypothetical protein